MKIRSITYFCNPRYPLEEKVIQKAGKFLANARAAYEAAGYDVQTVRLATIPFPTLLGEEHIEKLPTLTRQLADIASPLGIGYFSLGPALPEMPRSYQVIPDAIFVAKDAFFSGVMADKTRGIDLAAVRACAEVIVKCAPIEPNGFANLQFAALANVPAGAPFFPAAYHERDKPAFAIATQSADLAVQAFENAKSMEEGRNTLTAEIEKHGRKLAEIARSLRVKFYGIDFSLAPFPDDAHSLGNAVEKMGVPKIGLHGSLAAAALLTEAVERANFPHTGFSGFMQPVLEDSVLAKRAAEGTLTLKDALLYSAVCGTGLDTVPLPGDAAAEQLIPLLLDLSALALRLDKPLTARLMPVPGKQAGDETNFDFGFFANSKVMALASSPLAAPFHSKETLHITKR
ncbi:MAG: PFL family protein [Anaerolineales bacterium]